MTQPINTCGFIFLGSSHFGFNFFDLLYDTHFSLVISCYQQMKGWNEDNVSFCGPLLKCMSKTNAAKAENHATSKRE